MPPLAIPAVGIARYANALVKSTLRAQTSARDCRLEFFYLVTTKRTISDGQNKAAVWDDK